MVKTTLKLLTLMLAAAWPVTAVLAVFDPPFAFAALAATIGLALVTWLLYVEAMRLKRKRDRDSLKLWHYPWAIVVLGIGLPVDALLNVVVGIYWRERPREWLLTTRLNRWAEDDSNPRRQAWAQRVCRKLNKHDDGHCFDGDFDE